MFTQVWLQQARQAFSGLVCLHQSGSSKHVKPSLGWYVCTGLAPASTPSLQWAGMFTQVWLQQAHQAFPGLVCLHKSGFSKHAEPSLGWYVYTGLGPASTPSLQWAGMFTQVWLQQARQAFPGLVCLHRSGSSKHAKPSLGWYVYTSLAPASTPSLQWAGMLTQVWIQQSRQAFTGLTSMFTQVWVQQARQAFSGLVCLHRSGSSKHDKSSLGWYARPGFWATVTLVIPLSSVCSCPVLGGSLLGCVVLPSSTWSSFDLFPLLHSVQRLVRLLSFILVICPACFIPLS